MLTVLGYEGPQLRVYLAALKAANIPVARLVMLVLDRDAKTKKPMLGFLPATWRRNMALRLQDSKMNHWPRTIARQYPAFYNALVQQALHHFELSPTLYEGIFAPQAWREYPKHIDYLPAYGVADPAVAAWMHAQVQGPVLFTGGGILPAALLDTPAIRFLHIHPGYLPHVRGADGLLWSLLVRGRPGASMFYMEPGIDTGDIIHAQDYAAFTFDGDIPEGMDARMLYRVLFTVIDPIMRARTLLLATQGKTDWAALPSVAQSEEAGDTYHFMHAGLQKKGLKMLFPRWQA